MRIFGLISRRSHGWMAATLCLAGGILLLSLSGCPQQPSRTDRHRSMSGLSQRDSRFRSAGLPGRPPRGPRVRDLPRAGLLARVSRRRGGPLHPLLRRSIRRVLCRVPHCGRRRTAPRRACRPGRMCRLPQRARSPFQRRATVRRLPRRTNGDLPPPVPTPFGAATPATISSPPRRSPDKRFASSAMPPKARSTRKKDTAPWDTPASVVTIPTPKTSPSSLTKTTPSANSATPAERPRITPITPLIPARPGPAAAPRATWCPPPSPARNTATDFGLCRRKLPWTRSKRARPISRPTAVRGVAGCHDGTVEGPPVFDVNEVSTNTFLQNLYESRYGS